MTRYFVADLHLGHKKTADIRYPSDQEDYSGPDSVTKMDKTIIRQLSKLNKRDVLYILGDISGGRKDSEEAALNTLKYIKDHTRAKFHLISGNHDSVSSIHKDGWKRMDRFREVFDSVRDFAEISVNGTDVLLSHYPYEVLGDGLHRQTSRYHEFRLPDKGRPLIHGHTHQTNHIESIYMNMFCVSWDAARGLVSDRDLESWIEDWSDPEAVYRALKKQAREVILNSVRDAFIPTVSIDKLQGLRPKITTFDEWR